MLTHYAPNTCSLASHIALIEVGAPYALKTEQFAALGSRAGQERPRCDRLRRSGCCAIHRAQQCGAPASESVSSSLKLGSSA